MIRSADFSIRSRDPLIRYDPARRHQCKRLEEELVQIFSSNLIELKKQYFNVGKKIHFVKNRLPPPHMTPTKARSQGVAGLDLDEVLSNVSER